MLGLEKEAGMRLGGNSRLCLFLACFFAAFLLLAVGLTACDGGSAQTQMGQANPGKVRSAKPDVLKAKTPGKLIASGGGASMDYSNTSQGYFCVKSNLGGKKVKVLVEHPSSTKEQYQFTLKKSGQITIPLSEGNGRYNVSVFSNVIGNQYAQLFTKDFEVKLKDPNLPFLYPNQFVEFKKGDESTDLSAKLAKGATSDVEALGGMYDYVVDNITYDTQKAVTVASGYLPDNTDTIDSKTGICFDYAVLTASMLRAQRIPAKLVVGYAGKAYHAWIMVYTKDKGWVLGKAYDFPGKEFVQMDPTFDAAAKGTGQDLSSVIGSGTDYRPMFYY
jgi:hypothetical protein